MAHGFQTLEDGTEVCYQISEFYAPESARGYRWDDPALAIPWPEPVTVISEKDRGLPLFAEGAR
jgi:dTDP-4-dehydrorhamnose 3,5-epimerase